MPWFRRLTLIAPIVFALMLMFHFAATLLFLMPMNPIKMRLLPRIDRYMNPTFSQKWELFAPDPIVDTRFLLSSCALPTESGRVETQWSDMTTPVRELKYRYRFSPADRIERAQLAALHLAFATDDPLILKMKQIRDDAEIKRSLDQMDDLKKAQMAVAKTLLARLASADCDRLYGSGRAKEVRVRMVILKPPPFSQRDHSDESGETTYYDFDWAPYERVSSL